MKGVKVISKLGIRIAKDRTKTQLLCYSFFVLFQKVRGNSGQK